MNDGSDRCSPSGTADEPPQSGQAGRMYVDVMIDGGDWSAIANVEEAVIAAAASAAEFPETDLAGHLAAIALADDVRIATLNSDFRGKPTPTNVLSFPAAADLPSEDDEAPFVGDIMLAAETVMREAADLDIPATHHLQHLVVHGLLHLVGYDHGNDDEAEQMEALETRILATLGIADPYACDADASEIGKTEEKAPQTVEDAGA